jgi:DNA-binding response OmpR family regulator
MPKVMLIEDDETMLALLRMLLELEGYQVIEWGDRDDEDPLAELFAIIQRERPVLVMTDIHLRGLNGFDLLNRIRRERDLADVRVLMTSGMDFARECRQSGADGFMLKPYMPDELMDQIREMLRAED